MAVGQAAERAVRVEGERKLSRRVRPELRMRRQKTVGEVVVLLGFERAGRVDEPAAGLDERRRGLEDPCLARRVQREVCDSSPPLHFRIAPEDAEVRAGRVDEDAVAGGAEAGYLRLDRPLEGLDAPEPEPRHRLPHALEPSGAR